MYFVVIISFLLGINIVKGQDACTIAQFAVASNSVCQQALLALAMSNGTGIDSSNPVCVDPCYSLIIDVADNCPDFVSQLRTYITIKILLDWNSIV